MFSAMLESIKRDVIETLSKVRVRAEEDMAIPAHEQYSSDVQYRHDELSGYGGEEGSEAQQPEAAAEQPYVRDGRKVGRNEPCPCGSGKKYKQCHGRIS